MIRRRRRLALVAALIAALLLCASCGLSPEKEPHEISDRALVDLVNPPTSTTLPPPGDAQRSATLYFVNGEKLQGVQLQAGDGSVTPRRALTLLLNGLPPDADEGMTTSIPPDTTLRSADVTGTTLRIDLGGEKIKTLGGTAAKAAYAQLVFTALELSTVKSVRFAIDGDNIDAITDDGSLTVITAKNYKPPLNPR